MLPCVTYRQPLPLTVTDGFTVYWTNTTRDLMGVKWAEGGGGVGIVWKMKRRLHELPYLSRNLTTPVMRVSIESFHTTIELPTLRR